MSLKYLLNIKKQPIKDFHDIDALISQPVAFKILGVTHVLNPPSTLDFYKFIKALGELYTLEQNSKTADEIVDLYYRIISPIVPTISKSIVQKMTIQQANAVFNFVVETVVGKKSSIDEIDAQKKSLESEIIR